jgi:acetyl-CoA carboxylase carboxyl transferase subunit beta
MQMAKVSVAVEALHKAGLPFIAVLSDPTYGGVSASYAMQADVKIALSDARIGFAGPAVILNTMCEADQSKYDKMCPADFQSAAYVHEHGQVDFLVDNGNLIFIILSLTL